MGEQILVWSVWNVSVGALTWRTPFLNHDNNEINKILHVQCFFGERGRDVGLHSASMRMYFFSSRVRVAIFCTAITQSPSLRDNAAVDLLRKQKLKELKEIKN